MSKITASEIKIKMTEIAKQQLGLILVNDYTLENQIFRLKIDGKGCNGFDYALGFTEPQNDDIIYTIEAHPKNIALHLDPFTAHYCREGDIDYICDIDSDQEGFTYMNPNEKNYRGKFFKNEEMLPPNN